MILFFRFKKFQTCRSNFLKTDKNSGAKINSSSFDEEDQEVG